MNAPEDDHRQAVAGEQRPEARALVPYEYRSDEIDLVEVGVSLWRRWTLMLVVFLLCVLVAALIAFLIPHSYEYTTAIQIGSRVVGNQIQSIESSGSAASKLQKGYLPQVVARYSTAHGLDPKKFEFDVNAPAEADLVVISGQGRLSQAVHFKTIEKAAGQMLVASDARVIKNQQARLEARLAQAKAKLSQLTDSANLKLIKSQIKSLEAYKTQALKQQIASGRRGGDAGNAMSQLLLSTQAQQAIQKLSNLQQKLNNLPSEIDSQKTTVKSIQTQLDNIQTTQIVAGPIRSVKPVGLGRAVIIVLGVVIGVILALLAAAVANYLVAVRRRLAVTTDESA